jgi:D-tyrosyl-tRNA(Tyr) deacylase
MRALIQRCRGLTHIKINHHPEDTKQYEFNGPGLVVLLAWTKDDEGEELSKKEDWVLGKAMGLRVFPDKEDRMNNSLEKYLAEDALKEGGILWVPQFTLAGKLESGFRPSFSNAMDPQLARFRFNMFAKRIQEQTLPFKNIFGSFGADMELSFTNWGPVTLLLDTSER